MGLLINFPASLELKELSSKPPQKPLSPLLHWTICKGPHALEPLYLQNKDTENPEVLKVKI